MSAVSSFELYIYIYIYIYMYTQVESEEIDIFTHEIYGSSYVYPYSCISCLIVYAYIYVWICVQIFSQSIFRAGVRNLLPNCVTANTSIFIPEWESQYWLIYVYTWINRGTEILILAETGQNTLNTSHLLFHRRNFFPSSTNTHAGNCVS